MEDKKMIKETIIKIVNKEDLTYDEAKETMLEIMSGKTTPTQNAAFLASLSTKSAKAETIDEISGCAEAMRSLATPVPHPGMEVLEIVGTGGDGAHSFNISTTSAMVIASSGIKVAKHGNRAASSLSGTADCLEALGVNIQMDPDKALDMLNKTNFCFLFAQKYHAAMKYVGPIRKELGFRTVFNILGPLTNPAKPEMFLLGVYDEYLVEPVAKVLSSLGVKRGFVVYGQDKLDEISASAPTTVCEIKDGYYRTTVIKPEDFGLTRGSKDEIVGGTPEENADITRGILSGKITGTKRNIVLMNAGAALYIGGKADTTADGVNLAAELIDNGSALKTLENVIAESNK
jgi:anthranilate phosphoribosyltransferase